MAENEKTDDKKPPQKVKAKKGAWWNSSSTAGEKNKDTAEKKEQSSAKPKSSPRKKAPSKQVPAKGKPVQTTAKVESNSKASEQKTGQSTDKKTEQPRKRPSRYQRNRKQGYKGRGRRNNRYNKRQKPADVAVQPQSNLVVQKLRKPSVRRSLVREPSVFKQNTQQVKPILVRSSFPGKISFGQSLRMSAAEFTPLSEPVKPVRKPYRKPVKQAVHQVEKRPEEQKVEDEPKVVSKLLINAEEPEECRLALLENGRLESLHVSTVNRTQTKNNIYKARIVAVEPNLQAAFVDYGTDKNGFLPFSEIHPEYYKQNLSDETKQLVEKHQWKRLSIIDVVEKGQEVLVQVVKEEVGKKGANMTTYLSLPGRCVVLMPGSDSTGVSRKISGEGKRGELRDIMKGMGIPDGIGWIVRTASIDITENALSRDVEYLLRLWEETKKKGQEIDGVGMVYEDHHAVLRFLREHFDPNIEEILVDDQTAMEQVKEFVELLPRAQRDVRVRLHKGSRPIFNQFSVEDQIESIYQPQVNLPSGGSIVIDPTEALVAIDVNSGSTSKSKNFEASIFQANMEAAAELARQLRLRDLGGLIVVDFIDMRSNRNIREVERQVKNAMKRDKAKVDFSRISKFGLMQISRQKLGAPIAAGNYRVCEHCKGRGTVKSVESLALFYLRRIQTGASRKNVQQVECHFPLDVAGYLLNNKRQEIHELEKKYRTEIMVIAESGYKPAQNDIIFNKIEKEENK